MLDLPTTRTRADKRRVTRGQAGTIQYPACGIDRRSTSELIGARLTAGRGIETAHLGGDDAGQAIQGGLDCYVVMSVGSDAERHGHFGAVG